MSRRCISISGSSDCGRSGIDSQASPFSATREGTVARVSACGSMSSSSSHANGIETWAPGRGRTVHAPITVLWGAFWLKSTNTRSPRSSFHQAAVVRSGRRRSSSRARATAAARTTNESCSGRSRT